MQTGIEHAITLSIGADSMATTIQLPGVVAYADVQHPDGTPAQGPDPYSYVLAGLGACTLITVRMYAERKGWPMQAAHIKLWHERNYIADCEACEEAAAHLSRIVKHITFDGPLDDAQRKRLLQIAEQCPVNKSLRTGIAIVAEEVA